MRVFAGFLILSFSLITIEALLGPVALYKQALLSKPLLTNMISAGSLSVLSDSFTQKVENLDKGIQPFDRVSRLDQVL